MNSLLYLILPSLEKLFKRCYVTLNEFNVILNAVNFILIFF